VLNRASLGRLRISSNKFDNLAPMVSFWLTTTLFTCCGLVLGALSAHWFYRRKRRGRHPSSLLSAQVATLQGSWVEEIELFVHTPVKPYISPDDFQNQLREYTEKTRELVLTPGDPGPMPVTKISGTPWWPAGQPRPKCPNGHAM